jgi:colanic acid/amylovoran biosynthesis glycosyltransferase
MAQILHIGYFVSQYPAISHTFILREIIALRKLGFEINVASVNSVDRNMEDLTEEEQDEANHTFYIRQVSMLQVFWLNLRFLFLSPKRYLATLLFAIRLARTDVRRMLFGVFYFVEAVLLADWIKCNHTQHLHVHFATPAATVGLIASRLSNVALSITVHGPDEFYDVSQHQLSAKISGCSFLCVISTFARSQLMKLSPITEWEKFETVRLGVDPEIFVPAVNKTPHASFQVLCVGRLVPAKGQHILLKAAELVVQRGGDLDVCFVGDGPDRESLQSLAARPALAGRIRFEGSINQDRIRAFYNQADAFVLPSFAEGIPVVLMEAMSMRLPCIATRITGIPELIRDGIDGLLVAPSDHVELASAIERLMSSPELLIQLGNAGRTRVETSYRLGTNIEHLADVFRRRVRTA